MSATFLDVGVRPRRFDLELPSEIAEAFVAELIHPGQQSLDRARVLRELSAVRGEVYYSNGRRPQFRLSDGTYADSDATDTIAHHLVIRCHGTVAACSRLLPLTDLRTSTVAKLIGEQQFDAILQDLRVTAAETFEGSRWTVVPEFRQHNLGRSIFMLSWFVGRALGMKGAFLLAGTRDSQDKALCRLGARPVDRCPLIPAPKFSDDLRLLYVDVAHPSDTTLRRIHDATARLSLNFAPACVM